MKRLFRNWYARKMAAWEKQIAFRATNRVVRPFDWGIEWTKQWPVTEDEPHNGHDPEAYLGLLNRLALARSEDFFGYREPHFRFDGHVLRFETPAPGPHESNNTVHARYFPARVQQHRSKKAVVVLPHWNASAAQHVGLCKGIAALGISALRVSLPYHDDRMPPELERADYAVSSNIARTIDATRQAVIDTRACFDWLESRGYENLGIVGTSLGSCYAFLASAHDPRIKVNVYNHCSAYFADVVWTGISTLHIRQAMENHLDVDRLRAAWMAISPAHYFTKYAAMPKKSLFIYTSFDTTFLPELSRKAVEHASQGGLDHKVVVLPCGHYTLGEAPFKYIDGYQICSFLKRNL